MKKAILYQYLGTNGVITSPVHLEDIYYVRKIRLTADPGHILTNGTIQLRTIIVAEEDVEKWQEIPQDGQM